MLDLCRRSVDLPGLLGPLAGACPRCRTWASAASVVGDSTSEWRRLGRGVAKDRRSARASVCCVKLHFLFASSAMLRVHLSRRPMYMSDIDVYICCRYRITNTNSRGVKQPLAKDKGTFT